MVKRITMTYAIEQAEKEIQRDKADLKRLKKRYPGYDFVPIDAAETHTQRTAKKDFSELGGIVLSVVAVGMDREWTSREVFDNLRSQGVSLPEKEDAAMNAIGSALIELKDAELIRRSFEGKGRTPHRYTAITRTEKEAPVEETS
jgi:hypothetical protein